MVCFDDIESRIAWSLLVVSSVGYLTMPLWTSVRWWVRVFLSVTLSVLVYSLLRFWSNTFSSEWDRMLPAEFFLAVAFMATASCMVDLGGVLMAGVLLVPILGHNGQVVGGWVRNYVWGGAPLWLGTVLFVVAIVLLLWLVYRSRSMHWLALHMCALLAALNLTIAFTLGVIENYPSLDDTELCCFDAERSHRCPFAVVDRWASILFLSLTWALLEYVLYVTNERSCCGRRMGYHRVPTHAKEARSSKHRSPPARS